MAYLLVETADGERHIALDRDRFIIGRAPNNDVVIEHHQISRHHAEIRTGPEGWCITDLGSTNGIHVLGRRVERHILRSGEPVLLAPGVFIALAIEPQPGDVSVQPTAYVPALSLDHASSDVPRTYGLGGAVTPSWLPASTATAWGDSAGPGESVPSYGARATPIEGDLFRRKRARMSAGPSPNASLDMHGPVYGAAAAHLHLCQTCGQQTAPDSLLCQSCGCSIARECRLCHLSLLPIQDLCPRCQTPNSASVLRARAPSQPA